MRFQINLATRPWYNQRLVRCCLAGLLLAALLLAWFGLSTLQQQRQRLLRLQGESAALDKLIANSASRVTPQQQEARRRQVTALNGLLLRRNNHWLDLLDHLEKASPAGLYLTALTPEAGSAGIKLEGRVQSMVVLSLFLEQLGASSAFRNPRLLSTVQQDAGIGFSVSVEQAGP